MIDNTNYFLIIERENAKKIHSDQNKSREIRENIESGGSSGDLHSRSAKTARDRKK